MLFYFLFFFPDMFSRVAIECEFVRVERQREDMDIQRVDMWIHPTYKRRRVWSWREVKRGEPGMEVIFIRRPTHLPMRVSM